MDDVLNALRKEILFYIDNDVENEQTEFKAQFKFVTKQEQAEFIRDIISLANCLTLNPPKYSYLIFGVKNRKFLVSKGELNIEESNIRNILDSYIYPKLTFDFHKFIVDDSKEIGIFRIEHTGSIHFVNKDFKDNTQAILSTGNSWTRRGSSKMLLSPEMYLKFSDMQAKTTSNESELQVCIYQQETFQMNCSSLHSTYADSEYIHQRIEALLDLKERIEQYKLESQTVTEKASEGSPNSHPAMALILGLAVRQLTLVKLPRQEELVVLAKAHLNVRLTREFFDVGNLMTSPAILPFSQPEYQGTDEEKSKHELLLTFVNDLWELNGLLTVFTEIDSWYALPLVLRNIGSRYEEDIDVSLEFPSTVDLIEESHFPMPNDDVIDVFTEHGGALLNSIISQRGDFQVQRYDYRLPTRIPFSNIPSLTGPSIEDLQNEFKQNLHRFMMNFKLYSREDRHILNCHFKYLKHGSNMAFPAILFLKNYSDFSIQYTIKSKYHPEPQSGELSISL